MHVGLLHSSCRQYALNILPSSIQEIQLSSHEVGAPYAQNMSKEETFGDRLRIRMKEKGVTMPALAVGLKPRKNGVLEGDLGRAAVYGWINGNGFPNVIQLAAICRKLDISADYLLFGGISTQVSPQMERAAEAVKELTDEERMALFAAIHATPVSDAEVERHLPAPPPSPDYQGKEIEPFHPAQKVARKKQRTK